MAYVGGSMSTDTPLSLRRQRGPIRGPRWDNPDAIAAEIALFDPAALAVYADGVACLQQVAQVLTARARLADARQERAFLLRQLRSMEHATPAAVDVALAAVSSASAQPTRDNAASRSDQITDG